MKPELAARAHAVFTRALDWPRSDRDAMVSRECEGDATLEARVRRLLAAVDQRTGFLETPALNEVGVAWNKVPDAVGNYLVVGVLGTGGMATVYEAVQENPSRRVAIKVMHQGLTHTDAYLRFRLETEALARLHHPGIAQIYEAGTAQLGQAAASPFFAMELVPQALSLTAYAAKQRLDLRRRLEMFATVCDAVTHGHQQGIIHRDLKPGNVLVGPDGRAKVIDFGIARSTDATAKSVTEASDVRRLIGTLNYMSPEQCGTPTGVDIRADVYSLGVILFELVTGRLPHDLSGLSIPAAVRVITEEDAPKASGLVREARGDLDAIIAKAIEKDRERRYSGADALAADVRRFLDDLPTEARPAGTVEQVRKLARRNKPLAAAVALVAVTLVAGLAVSWRFGYVASKARDAALQRETELETVTAFQESLLSGVDASAMGEQLRSALATLVANAGADDEEGATAEFARLTRDVNFTSLAIEALHESVLKRYRVSIDEKFQDQPGLRARLLQQLADTMNTLGLHAQAEPVIREALAVRRAQHGEEHVDTLQSMHSLGSLLATLGRYEESMPHLRAAHQGRVRVLGPEHRLTLRAASSLAGLLRRMGNAKEAEVLWAQSLSVQRRVLGSDHPDTLRTLNNLGVAFAAQGRADQAEKCWRELIERRRRLFGEDHPEYRGSLGNLGALLQEQGRFSEARPLLEQALASDRKRRGDRHATTLTALSQLASLLEASGDDAGAEKLYRECAELRRETLGPTNRATLQSTVSLAAALHRRGERETGWAMLSEALAAQRRLLGDGHSDTVTAISIAAEMRHTSGHTSEALALAREALALSRAHLEREPWSIGRCASHLGGLLTQTGDLSEARTLLLEGYELLRSSLGERYAESVKAARRLAHHFETSERLEPGVGHAAEAARWKEAAQQAVPNRASLP